MTKNRFVFIMVVGLTKIVKGGIGKTSRGVGREGRAFYIATDPKLSRDGIAWIDLEGAFPFGQIA